MITGLSGPLSGIRRAGIRHPGSHSWCPEADRHRRSKLSDAASTIALGGPLIIRRPTATGRQQTATGRRPAGNQAAGEIKPRSPRRGQKGSLWLRVVNTPMALVLSTPRAAGLPPEKRSELDVGNICPQPMLERSLRWDAMLSWKKESIPIVWRKNPVILNRFSHV